MRLGRDQLLYGVCYETRYLDLRKKFPRFLFPQWHISWVMWFNKRDAPVHKRWFSVISSTRDASIWHVRLPWATKTFPSHPGHPTTPFWSQDTPGIGISAYPTSLATPAGSRTSKTPVPTSRKRSNKENELPTVFKRQMKSHHYLSSRSYKFFARSCCGRMASLFSTHLSVSLARIVTIFPSHRPKGTRK